MSWSDWGTNFCFIIYITFIMQEVIIVNSSVPLFSRSVDYVASNQSSLEQLHALYQYTDNGSHTCTLLKMLACCELLQLIWLEFHI